MSDAEPPGGGTWDQTLPDDDLPALPELPELEHLWEASTDTTSKRRGERYEEKGELGRGGMGVVLRTLDRDFGREVAMKLLLSDSPSKEEMDRFMEEAQITGQLEHPNICPIHEMGLDRQGRLFFTMKMVKGRSLQDRIRTAERIRVSGLEVEDFPLRERLEIFQKVCDAIAYGHSRKVIHRDLKPANVMVGEFGEVLVMDWGLAKILARGEDPFEDGETIQSDRTMAGVGLTMVGKVAGTPTYMSPEQARGETHRIDHRTDVYALGAILYELLTFVPPFEEDSPEEILVKVAKGHFTPPSIRMRRRKGTPMPIPRELEAIVLKAMHIAPAKRYWSARSLRDDIDNFLSGRRVRAAHYSPWEIARKWAAQNKALAIGGSAIAVCILVGLIGTTWTLMASSARRQKAQLAADREAMAKAAAAREEVLTEQLTGLRLSAESRWTEGESLLSEAERQPFRYSAPQEWFRAVLPALSRMGVAILDHPVDRKRKVDVPDRWRVRLGEATTVAFENALAIRDWALADLLARSAEMWGARTDARSMLRTVTSRRENQEREDIDALEDMIRTISGAEAGLDEMARQAAVLPSQQAIASRVLNQLSGGAPLELPQRMFLITLVGKLDPESQSSSGETPVSVVQKALGGDVRQMMLVELEQWLDAAARLEATRPGSFERPDIETLFSRVSTRVGNLGLAEAAVQRARGFLAIARGDRPLPDPDEDPARYRHLFRQLVDWVSTATRSGASFTSLLLDAADDRSLSDRQRGFVLEVLGSYGDVTPPDPARPDRNALDVLRRTLAAPSGSDLRWSASQRDDSVVWQAVAAARSLARLGDARSTPVYWAKSYAADYEAPRFDPSSSLFDQATAELSRFLPMDDWEPRTVEEFLIRSRAWQAIGRWQESWNDLQRALQSAPENLRVLDAVASFQAAIFTSGAEETPERRQSYEAALSFWNRALEIDPRDALSRQNRGEFVYNQVWTGHLRWPTQSAERGELQKQCTEDLRLAAEVNPDLSKANYLYGYIVKGETGIAHMKRAVEVDPYFSEGWYFLQLVDRENALSHLTQALKYNPYYTRGYQARIALLVQMGERARAIEDLSAMMQLQTNPFGQIQFQVMRGQLRLESGDPGGAEDLEPIFMMFDQAPNERFHPGLWGESGRSLALFWASQGQTDRALALLTRMFADRRNTPEQWSATKQALYQVDSSGRVVAVNSSWNGQVGDLGPMPDPLRSGRFIGRWGDGVSDGPARDGRPVDVYTFEAAKGQRLEITVFSTETDPIVRLVRPNGSEVVNDDNTPPQTDAKIAEELRREGTYTIEIIGQRGNVRGTYRVLIVVRD